MIVLMTGATGMLGAYLKEIFAADEVSLVGRSRICDFICDLSASPPVFPEGYRPELVVHAAGTEDNEGAVELNEDCTLHLLEALGPIPPRYLVYVSSWQVYSPGAGEDVDEQTHLLPAADAGKSKARAEALLARWCLDHGVVLTILRPATMFGSGMKGWAHSLFNDVVGGRYVHLRGEDGRVSVVTALDVARAAKALHSKGGVYNLSDGENPTFLQLAEAMSANAGQMKRVSHLPPKWADFIYHFARFVPWVGYALDPARLASRSRSMTLSSAAASRAGLTFHRVTDVLRRIDDDYPYSD